MNNTISVIIPTWNSEKTLGATIQSCLNQTLPPMEILVCDDGSTDNSKEVIEQINDSKVVWVPSLRSGTPAIPRNNGMKVSNGEWIAFCDSDDEWLPTKLEKQIHLAEKLKCKVMCTNALIKKNNIVTNKTVSNWSKNKISFKNLLHSNEIVCSSTLLHKSIYNKIGGFPEELKYKGFEDYLYWLRVTTQTNVLFMMEPLVIYDDHPETSIRSHQIPDSEIKKLSFYNFTEWININEKNIIKTIYFNYCIYIYKIKQNILSKIKYLIKLTIK